MNDHFVSSGTGTDCLGRLVRLLIGLALMVSPLVLGHAPGEVWRGHGHGHESEVPLAASDDANRTQSPYFVTNVPPGDFPLLASEVDIRVAGVIAEVHLVQRYRNRGEVPIEAEYHFPLSTRAAVHGFEFRLDDRVVEGVIRERGQARREFDEARAEGKRAALLEQQRPNVFTTALTNIQPGEEVEVEIRYTELLECRENDYLICFPTVVGPRYAGDRADSGDDGFVANPTLEPGVPAAPVDPAGEPTAATTLALNLRVDAGMQLVSARCDSHQLPLDFVDADTVTARLAAAPVDQIGNRDFRFRYRVSGETVDGGVLLHREPGEAEGTVLVHLQPPTEVEPDEIPPRELIFVVDTSGSMRGEPMATSLELMGGLLANLRAQDSFNVVSFAGGSQVLFERSRQADVPNLAEASRFLAQRRAGGGTELSAALARAAALPKSEEGVSRSLILLTDGFISFEDEAFQAVGGAHRVGNVFAIGIGSSPNRHLIEGVARVAGGEHWYLAERDEAVVVAQEFREAFFSLALTDIEVRFAGIRVDKLEPVTVPDLFARRPLVLAGHFRSDPDEPVGARVVVTGRNAGGPVRIVREIEVGAAGLDQPALPRLWARQRIERLEDRLDLLGGGRGGHRELAEELEGEIVETGLAHSLASRFTSFVAIDQEVIEDHAEPRRVTQPVVLPAKVPVTAVGGGTVPEPGFVGLWLVLLASLLGGYRVRR